MEETPDEELPEWPRNAFRDTAASVAVALKKPMTDLLFQFGHAGGEETIKKHFLGPMKLSEAKAIWNLTPENKS